MNDQSAAKFYNIEAEQALLGTVLTNNEAFNRVADVLRAEHFYDPVHQRIFTLCQSRILAKEIASPVTLKSLMEGDAGLKELGGPAYLARIAGAAISAAAIRSYAGTIIADAARRTLSEGFSEGKSQLLAGVDPGEVKLGLLRLAQSLPEVAGKESSISLLKAMASAMDDAVKSYHNHTSFLKTGIDRLDAIIKGLGPGDLCLLGGATSMGKTAVGLEIAGNVAITQGKGVVYVSLEMMPGALSDRLAAARAGISYSALRDASEMSESDFKKYIEAGQAISDAPLRVIPKYIRDIDSIHSAVDRAGGEMKSLDLIVVDYAQLVNGPGREIREKQGEVAKGLDRMAKLLGIPVLGLVQIDRKIGERENKRPRLTDIRETAEYENAADQVVFVHRESYYLERQGGPLPGKNGQISDSDMADHEADLARWKNRMELIVPKNRHGSIAHCEIGCHMPTNRFWRLGDEPEGI